MSVIELSMKANQLLSYNIVFFLDHLEFFQLPFILIESWPQRQLSPVLADRALVGISLFHSFFDLHRVLFFASSQKLFEKETLKLG